MAPPKFEDNETTVDQLKGRLTKAVAYLKMLDPKAIDASVVREITFPLGPKTGQMKGADCLNHLVLPNFISTLLPLTPSHGTSALISVNAIFCAPFHLSWFETLG